MYTTCRHEKRIALHLQQREIEHYLPLYRADRKWRDGSKVTLDFLLFPGYIFARIKRSERGSVLSVPGALAIVGGTGESQHRFRIRPSRPCESAGRSIAYEPHPLLRVGQVARVRSGAFAGMEGVVVRKKSGFRIVLTLEQIMQSVAIELDEDDVEPLTSGRFRQAGLLEIGHGLCVQGA